MSRGRRKDPTPQPQDATWTDQEVSPDTGDATPHVTVGAAGGQLRERAADRYELGELHGEGGLGQVLLAFDRELERTVAIKQLRRPDPMAEARFLREARITARLEHPAIVPVHDVGKHPGGQPFYAMKLVSGKSFKDAIHAASGLDARLELLPSLLAVAEAMAYAHSRGVVHRDLKPSNIVLGEFGEAVVIDWGLAKELDDAELARVPARTPEAEVPHNDLTQEGDVLGTPAYMAPEQAGGEPVDARADVYALGAVLYHLLAGEPPYRGRESREVLELVQDGPPTPIADRVPKAAPELLAIVDKAMARDPASRYEDASGFRDDLRRFESGRLVQAHRYTIRQRVGRFLRRHRLPLLSSALAALVVGLWGRAASPTNAEVCQIDPTPLERAWPERSRQIATSFAGAGDGSDTWVLAKERIDDRLNELSNARRKACVDTQRGLQSPELLDLRLLCLAQRDAEVEALVDRIGEGATLEIVGGVLRALYELPAVESCSNPEFASRAPMPADESSRREIRAINSELARVRALALAGKRDGIDESIVNLLRRAVAVGYAPSESLAHYARAPFLLSTGRIDEALASYRAAAITADRGGDDLARARAEAGVARTLASFDEQVAEAEKHMRRLEAVADRLGTVEAQALVVDLRADIAYERGDYKTAEREARSAVELLSRIEGEAGVDALGSLRRLGQSLYEQRLADRAVEVYRVALARAERTLGSQHIEVARILGELGNSLARARNYEEAYEARKRALELTRTVMGDRVTTEYVFALLNYAVSLARKGEREEALQQYRDALPLMATLFGEEHTRVADVHVNISSELSKLGRHDEAIDEAQRAVDMYVVSLGKGHVRTADTLWLLGRRLENADRGDEAVSTYERSVKWFQLNQGTPPVAPMQAWLDLGNLLLQQKRWRDGRRVLEEARAAVNTEPDRVSPFDRSWLDYLLLRARAGARRPGPSARDEAARIRAVGEELGDSELVAEIDGWLSGSAGSESGSD